MKNIFLISLILSVLFSCKTKTDIETARNEVMQAEKAFEKMASEKGMAEAFYFFAADDAVIRRGNDSLIKGRENIRTYYTATANPNASLNWTPDFIGISDCGTLAYTYGKYTYSLRDSTGKATEQTGIFHTVWKKENKVWKYVWD